MAPSDRLHDFLIVLALPATVMFALVGLGALTWAAALAILVGFAVAVLIVLLRRQTRVVVPATAGGNVAPEPSAEQVLERLPDPVILLNGRREVLAANRPAREVLGVGGLGRDLALSLRHPDVLAAAEAVVADAPPLVEEITFPAPIMRTFILFASGLPSRRDPAAPSILLVLREETQVKRAEQSRADFVANATHELRSPLAAIIGFIETLGGPARDDAEARDRFLALMHGEAERMSRLVDDLMSLSRVEINEHVPPRIAVDLRAIVAGVASALAVRAEGRQMTIAIEGPPRLPAVRGDPDQLTQVFHNLIDNAVKYGRQGTPIRVVLGDAPFPGTGRPGIAVKVIDQGEGIAALQLPRLTERFYRVDEGRSRRLGGTGLGLAIVKHIVRRHRGRLTIESELGQGSTFTVHLPAIGEEAVERADEAALAEGSAVTKL